MPTAEPLAISASGGVAELRLSRPDLLNRFDDELIDALPAALRRLAADAEVRAVLWTAEGRHFSAGGDMESMLAVNGDPELLRTHIDAGRGLFRAFADFPKPLVVALRGNVFGLATTLALTADAIVSFADVEISDPHVHMALAAGDGGCVAWPANLALTTAKRKLLWGEPLSGADAHRLGLVTDLVGGPDEVEPRARELAHQVASLAPVAVQMTKRTLNRALQARGEDVLDLGFYLEMVTASTADVREAVTAFRERRDPVWGGR